MRRSSPNTLNQPQFPKVKEHIAREIGEAMRRHGITKTHLAASLKTGRHQVNRILDQNANVMLSTLVRAAELVGCHITVTLKPQGPHG